MASLTDFDPDNYTAVNGVDEAVGVETEPVTLSAMTQMNKIQQDMDSVAEAMETLDVIVDIRGAMKDSEEGASPVGARVAEICIEDLCDTVGYYPREPIIVGLEHFKDPMTRKNATSVAVESMGDWFAKVWAAIVRTCKMIMEKLMGFIHSIWSEADNKRRSNFYHANKSKIEAAHAVESRGKPEPIRITDSRIIETFRMEGRPVNKESVMEVSSNMEMFAASLEELGKNFEPYLGSVEDFLIEYVDVIEAAANGKMDSVESISAKYEDTLKKASLVLEALYKKAFDTASTIRLPKTLEHVIKDKQDVLVSRPLAGCCLVYFTKESNLGNGIERYKTNIFEERPMASEYEDSELYTFSAGELDILQGRIKKINESMEKLGDLIHNKHAKQIKAVMTQLDDVPKLAKLLTGDFDNEEYVINLSKLLGQTVQDMIQDYANLFVRSGVLLSNFEKGFELFFNVSIRNILQNSTK